MRDPRQKQHDSFKVEFDVVHPSRILNVICANHYRFGAEYHNIKSRQKMLANQCIGTYLLPPINVTISNYLPTLLPPRSTPKQQKTTPIAVNVAHDKTTPCNALQRPL
jgi:hypothetical protein